MAKVVKFELARTQDEGQGPITFLRAEGVQYQYDGMRLRSRKGFGDEWKGESYMRAFSRMMTDTTWESNSHGVVFCYGGKTTFHRENASVDVELLEARLIHPDLDELGKIIRHNIEAVHRAFKEKYPAQSASWSVMFEI